MPPYMSFAIQSEWFSPPFPGRLKSVGYDSEVSFSKALKRVLGMAPREFRRSTFGTREKDYRDRNVRGTGKITSDRGIREIARRDRS